MYHNIIIVGRLGRDPEMRFTPSGEAVTTISVATDRAWNDKNGQLHRETTWFRVSVFGKTAENVNQYLSKGRVVLVEGRLVVDPKTGGPRVYQRQDGSCGASFEVVANNIRFLSTRSDGEGAASAEAATSVTADSEEGMPFDEGQM
ncbi:MAG: single-stranded DNA-binding protein [Thermoflexales bacterium]